KYFWKLRAITTCRARKALSEAHPADRFEFCSRAALAYFRIAAVGCPAGRGGTLRRSSARTRRSALHLQTDCHLRDRFSVFFGASAIYNERRSRRILGVLSKAVARDQYLAGLILGVTLACAIYCFALGVTATWTLGGAGFPISQVWFLMLCLVAACVLAGTVALMFSTFLHPFLAAGAAALVLGLPALASLTLSVRW